MRISSTVACGVVAGGMIAVAGSAFAQAGGQAGGAVTGTDVYHVHFTKAAPGEAAALGDALAEPDKSSPMPTHFIVLRHQEGDDWDYAVVEHLGPKAEVTVASTAPAPQRPLSAWHSDTFVAGPSWADFSRALGIGEGATAGAVYIVSVHRPAPGHREQMLKSLSSPPPSGNAQAGDVLLTHLEGGEWSFMTITRYNSWRDLATDRTNVSSGPRTNPGGWADMRQHSAFHRDTIADRTYPK
jgi:hypothetical protein